MNRRRLLEGHRGNVLAAVAAVALAGVMLVFDLNSPILLLVLALPVCFLSHRAGRAIREWFLRSRTRKS